MKKNLVRRWVPGKGISQHYRYNSGAENSFEQRSKDDLNMRLEGISWTHCSKKNASIHLKKLLQKISNKHKTEKWTPVYFSPKLNNNEYLPILFSNPPPTFYLKIFSWNIVLLYVSFVSCCMYLLGLPGWFGGKDLACQCRRHRFNPWMGKIPWRRK